MQITFTPEQVALLRTIIEPVYAAHAEAESLPPGFSIVIEFVGPYGTQAIGQCGNLTVDLGDVAVHPEQLHWGLTD